MQAPSLTVQGDMPLVKAPFVHQVLSALLKGHVVLVTIVKHDGLVAAWVFDQDLLGVLTGIIQAYPLGRAAADESTETPSDGKNHQDGVRTRHRSSKIRTRQRGRRRPPHSAHHVYLTATRRDYNPHPRLHTTPPRVTVEQDCAADITDALSGRMHWG